MTPRVLMDSSVPEAPERLGHFAVGDPVEKFTGDYYAFGIVRGVFELSNGAIRYAVEHKAEGGGSFTHIYNGANLRRDTRVRTEP
jgi:hypothetical protein